MPFLPLPCEPSWLKTKINKDCNIEWNFFWIYSMCRRFQIGKPFFSYVGAMKAHISLYRDKTAFWCGKEYKKSFSGGRYNNDPSRWVFMKESSITGPRFLSQENKEFRNEKRALEVNVLTQPSIFHVDLISSQIDAILLQIKTCPKM
jgi:hypothetical protein